MALPDPATSVLPVRLDGSFFGPVVHSTLQAWCSRGSHGVPARVSHCPTGHVLRYIAAVEKGYYRELCLNVMLVDGNGSDRSTTGADLAIPWFLDYLQAVDMGLRDRHIAQVTGTERRPRQETASVLGLFSPGPLLAVSRNPLQIFTRGGWRYMRLPPQNPGEQRPTVLNFGELTGGIRFGISQTRLDAQIASLLSKYSKTYCGAYDYYNKDVFHDCETAGSVDIVFVAYGFDVNDVRSHALHLPPSSGRQLLLLLSLGLDWVQAVRMDLPYLMGMSYNELGKLLTIIEGNNFKYTINSPSSRKNIVVYDPRVVDNLELPEDGLAVAEELITAEPLHNSSRTTLDLFMEARGHSLPCKRHLHCRPWVLACL